MAIKLSEHFTYEEMVASATAKRLGLSNAPDAKSLDNLKRLCQDVLEPLRVKWGRPIVVNSAYRSPAVNKAVGGAKNSDHRFGAAADIRTTTNTREDNRKLFNLAVRMANEGEIECRQIIDEYGYQWVHISINHADNSAKINQVLHLK